jgi:hypothetical protein
LENIIWDSKAIFTLKTKGLKKPLFESGTFKKDEVVLTTGEYYSISKNPSYNDDIFWEKLFLKKTRPALFLLIYRYHWIKLC